MKKIILVLIIITTILESCKKFPDGPCISFRSVIKRIEGTYKVDKFFINGADSTTEFNTKLGCEIEFSKTTTSYNPGGYYVYLINCNNGKSYTGDWAYAEHNSNFYIGFIVDSTMQNGIGPFGYGRTDAGIKILRLTDKEFNFEAFDPGGGLWDSNPQGTQYIINLVKV